MEIMVFELHSL